MEVTKLMVIKGIGATHIRIIPFIFFNVLFIISFLECAGLPGWRFWRCHQFWKPPAASTFQR